MISRTKLKTTKSKKRTSPKGEVLFALCVILTKLLEQAENAGAGLVRLSEHSLSSLHENVVLRVVRHRLCHVGVADGGLGSLDVLACRRQVLARVVQAALNSADRRLLVECLCDRVVKNVDGSIRLVARADVQRGAIRTLEAESLSTHIRHADADRLVGARANLEVHRVVLRVVLRTNRLGESIEDSVRGLVDVALRVRDAERDAADRVADTRAASVDRNRALTGSRVDRIASNVRADDGRCTNGRSHLADAGNLADDLAELARTDREGRRHRLALVDVGNRDRILRMDVEVATRAVKQTRQSRSGLRRRAHRLVRERRRRSRDLLVVRTVDEILAVERDVRIVIDLVDALVELLLDRLTIVIRVRVVRSVDDLLLEGLEDVNRAGNSALSNLHHAVAVLRVLVVLIERTDLDAHALGNRIARSVIDSAVDLHARRNLLEARRERALILVQRVQRVDRHHVVLNYQCHLSFPPWLFLFSLLPGILVRCLRRLCRPCALRRK